MNPNHCPPELVLAGIIRKVDGKHNLSPDTLAEAILKHPGSCWGPAQPAAPMPSHKDLIDFACEQKHWKAWLEPGGCLENAHFELSDLIQAAIKKWGFQSAVAISPEAGYERIPDDVDPEQRPPDAQRIDGEWWAPRYGFDSLAKVLEQAQPPALAAPWPELPEEPADMPSFDQCCEQAFLSGWQAARAELQRQREQAQPPPPAAWPEISDSLICRLVGDYAAIASQTTISVCFGHHVDPIKEARACLLEVLVLAAKEGAK